MCSFVHSKFKTEGYLGFKYLGDVSTYPEPPTPVQKYPKFPYLAQTGPNFDLLLSRLAFLRELASQVGCMRFFFEMFLFLCESSNIICYFFLVTSQQIEDTVTSVTTSDLILEKEFFSKVVPQIKDKFAKVLIGNDKNAKPKKEKVFPNLSS